MPRKEFYKPTGRPPGRPPRNPDSIPPRRAQITLSEDNYQALLRFVGPGRLTESTSDMVNRLIAVKLRGERLPLRVRKRRQAEADKRQEPQYLIRLSDDLRAELLAVERADPSVYKRRRATILLLADQAREGGPWSDRDIAEYLHVSLRLVADTRRNVYRNGIEREGAPETVPV